MSVSKSSLWDTVNACECAIGTAFGSCTKAVDVSNMPQMSELKSGSVHSFVVSCCFHQKNRLVLWLCGSSTYIQGLDQMEES